MRDCVRADLTVERANGAAEDKSSREGIITILKN